MDEKQNLDQKLESDTARIRQSINRRRVSLSNKLDALEGEVKERIDNVKETVSGAVDQALSIDGWVKYSPWAMFTAALGAGIVGARLLLPRTNGRSAGFAKLRAGSAGDTSSSLVSDLSNRLRREVGTAAEAGLAALVGAANEKVTEMAKNFVQSSRFDSTADRFAAFSSPNVEVMGQGSRRKPSERVSDVRNNGRRSRGPLDDLAQSGSNLNDH